jgi:hypothetical protein
MWAGTYIFSPIEARCLLGLKNFLKLGVDTADNLRITQIFMKGFGCGRVARAPAISVRSSGQPVFGGLWRGWV